MKVIFNRRPLRFLFAGLVLLGILFIIKGTLVQEPVTIQVEDQPNSNPTRHILHTKQDSQEFNRIDKNHFLVKDKVVGPEKPAEKTHPRVRGKLPVVQPIPASVPKKQKSKAKSKASREPLNVAIEAITSFNPKTDSIPRIIHQTYGTPILPHTLSQLVAKFRKQENYTHILWTDYDIDLFVKRFHPAVYPLYRNIPIPFMRSDLARYLLLFSFGGVYCDIEMDLVMDVHKWYDKHSPSLLLGLQRATSSNNGQDNIQFADYVIASSPGHEVLAKAIYTAQKRLKGAKEIHVSETDYLTGKRLWTDSILEILKIKGVTANKLKDISEPLLVEDVYILPRNGFGGDKSSINELTRAIRQVGAKPFL